MTGRLFADADTQNSEPVVILNEAAAARYFPGEDALGKVVRLVGDRTVVGVVGHMRHDGPESGWRTQAFVPLAQSRVLGATLVVRTASRAQGILPAVRQVALGAQPSAILRSVLGSALLTMLVRIAIGLIGAWGLSGLVRPAHALYGSAGRAAFQAPQLRRDCRAWKRASVGEPHFRELEPAGPVAATAQQSSYRSYDDRAGNTGSTWSSIHLEAPANSRSRQSCQAPSSRQDQGQEMIDRRGSPHTLLSPARVPSLHPKRNERVNG